MNKETVAANTYPDQSALILHSTLQYGEPIGSFAINRNMHNIASHGVYVGFDYALTGGLNVTIASQGEEHTIVARHKGFSLTIHAQHPQVLSIPVGRKSFVVINSFYSYGIKTKQVDSNSNIDAAEYKILPENELLPHHVIIVSFDVPLGTIDLTEAMASIEDRTTGGFGIQEHLNAIHPHKQYLRNDDDIIIIKEQASISLLTNQSVPYGITFRNDRDFARLIAKKGSSQREVLLIPHDGDYVNFTTRLTENGQRVYSPNNKPSAATLGCLPNKGLSELNGQLIVKNSEKAQVALSASGDVWCVESAYKKFRITQGYNVVKFDIDRTGKATVYGTIFEGEHRVYSHNNKPTAADLAVVSIEDQWRIEAKEIGNASTAIDLQQLWEHGEYRSARSANQWLNKPDGCDNAFTLTVKGIGGAYKELVIKDITGKSWENQQLNHAAPLSWTGWADQSPTWDNVGGDEFLKNLGPTGIQVVENKDLVLAANKSLLPDSSSSDGNRIGNMSRLFKEIWSRAFRGVSVDVTGDIKSGGVVSATGRMVVEASGASSGAFFQGKINGVQNWFLGKGGSGDDIQLQSSAHGHKGIEIRADGVHVTGGSQAGKIFTTGNKPTGNDIIGTLDGERLTIKHKKSIISGEVPTKDQVEEAELLLNLADKKIYTLDHEGEVISIGGAASNNEEVVVLFTGNVRHGKTAILSENYSNFEKISLEVVRTNVNPRRSFIYEVNSSDCLRRLSKNELYIWNGYDSPTFFWNIYLGTQSNQTGFMFYFGGSSGTYQYFELQKVTARKRIANPFKHIGTHVDMTSTSAFGQYIAQVNFSTKTFEYVDLKKDKDTKIVKSLPSSILSNPSTTWGMDGSFYAKSTVNNVQNIYRWNPKTDETLSLYDTFTIAPHGSLVVTADSTMWMNSSNNIYKKELGASSWTLVGVLGVGNLASKSFYSRVSQNTIIYYLTESSSQSEIICVNAKYGIKRLASPTGFIEYATLIGDDLVSYSEGKYNPNKLYRISTDELLDAEFGNELIWSKETQVNKEGTKALIFLGTGSASLNSYEMDLKTLSLIKTVMLMGAPITTAGYADDGTPYITDRNNNLWTRQPFN